MGFFHKTNQRPGPRSESGAALVIVVILMGLRLALSFPIVYITVLPNPVTMDVVAEKPVPRLILLLGGVTLRVNSGKRR